MNLGICLYSNDTETVWNAFRLANFVVATGDSVRVFLLGKGVDFESLGTEKFNVAEQVKTFLDTGGRIWACGTCLKIHEIEPSQYYTVASMVDLYEILKESDKVITF